VTASTGPRGFRTEIGVRGHTLLADEPEALGGEDAGPTPYDLLVGALGACTSMTLQMYARRKQWPLREAIVHLRHSRVYAADQEHCADRPARLDRVERELELVGDLTAEQRARLLEIAGRCPVHRTLEAGVVVDTRLAAAE
jgi:putative redox protein